jgi:hypothetical protein
MVENFDNVFTIEVNGSKGWEVIATFTSLNTAINAYRNYLLKDFDEYRLNSPKADKELAPETATDDISEVYIDGWADVR